MPPPLPPQLALCRAFLENVFGPKEVDGAWGRIEPVVRHRMGHGDLSIPDRPDGPPDEWGGVWKIYDAD